ncbi:sigma-70 family RNA polymerase sigma factor [Luteolibacter yonseiensis]|uniref:RNA polymerase sigma factor n=1 Tax=Luteolibacter yonseiensis TaxID=1144680 RepID=A0A934R6X9_9BACT|nr:sigma-70 family RNA polymerase sigma factor [Luteolibacter yonseiensis]MBK1818441.1 sigma-70 family RNA polymerase sigma factor [Luteolibacter yonseiensis]
MPDSEAFTRVIAEHHSSLRHYIGGFGVNPAWVDDIAQDTFLVVYRKWDEFLAVDNPGAWLRTVAKNLVLNETAKLNRRERLFSHNLTKLLVEAEDAQTSTPPPPMPPETLEALRACLGHLTKKTRGVIEARYFGNMNSFQIGQEMAMKPAAVRKLLFHARQSLAECLRGKPIEVHW